MTTDNSGNSDRGATDKVQAAPGNTASNDDLGGDERVARTDLRMISSLRARADRFRDFAEASQDWFWETDRDYRFTYVSDQVTQALALLPEQLHHRCLTDLNDGAPTSPEWRQLTEDLQNRRPFRDVMMTALGPDGETIRLSISGKPIYNGAGTFIGYRGSSTNVTDRWEAAEKLKHAKDQAEIASRLKTEFLANMSHELRTPLNSIIGFSDVIRNQLMGPLENPKYVSYGEDINTSGRHLLSLLDDLMDLSRIETGTFELVEEDVDLAKAVKTSLRMLETRARSSGITMILDVPETLPLFRGDAVRIRQVIINLMTNAVKFTDAGGSVDVRLGTNAKGGLFMEIEDTGIGIEADELPGLFEPFRRAEASYQRQYEGTGLGLTIVKSFVDAHKGQLVIDSTPNEGTRVRIDFPASRSRATEVLTRAEGGVMDNVVSLNNTRP